MSEQGSRDVINYASEMTSAMMTDSEMRLRVLQNCSAGVKVASVCAGIDAAGEAFRLIECALAQSGAVRAGWFVPTSFCDVGKAQQQYLDKHAQGLPCNPCLFGALEDRWPLEVQMKCGLKDTYGSKGSAAAVKKAALSFHKEMAEKLQVHSAEAFPSSATSYCICHDQERQVRPNRSMP